MVHIVSNESIELNHDSAICLCLVLGGIKLKIKVAILVIAHHTFLLMKSAIISWLIHVHCNFLEFIVFFILKTFLLDHVLIL